MEYLYLYAPPPKKKEGPTVKPKPKPKPQARKVEFTWVDDMTVPSLQNLNRIKQLFKKENPLIDNLTIHDNYNDAIAKKFFNMLLKSFQNEHKDETITNEHLVDAMNSIPADNKKAKNKIEAMLKGKLINFPAAATAAT